MHIPQIEENMGENIFITLGQEKNSQIQHQNTIHKRKRKKQINWTPSKLKIYVPQKIVNEIKKKETD